MAFCNQCAAEFPGFNHWCDDVCRVAFQRAADRRAGADRRTIVCETIQPESERRRATRRVDEKITGGTIAKACIECGDEFFPRLIKTDHCSKRCYNAWFNRKTRTAERQKVQFAHATIAEIFGPDGFDRYRRQFPEPKLTRAHYALILGQQLLTPAAGVEA